VKAVGRPDARAGGWTFRAGPGLQLTHVPGLPLGTRGGILAKVDLPADGEYRVSIADIVTNIWGSGMEFANPLVVTVDSKVVYETSIGGEEDMKLYDQVQNGALDRVNARLKNIKFAATAGPHRIGVTFRLRTHAESDDQLQLFSPGGGQDRFYRINSFQLQGPFDVKGLSSTPSRDRIFVCHTQDRDCAKTIVATLAKRAYRRPVNAEDVNELLQYYDAAVKQGAFEDGIRSAITGLLASPFFLYRGEHVPGNVRPGGIYAISDLELASNLSFFLWNSIPDDELLQAASDRKLSEPAMLDKQVRRMLADPRSITLAGNFLPQWLDMKRLDEIVPDNAVFPYASGRSDPREDFKTELRLFADSIFRDDRSVVDLLRARHTYLNERIALHYGLTDVKGDHFRRVELAQSARWGLLGKGAVLMAAAYPNRTSPVLRGRFILEHIQGVPPANPPPNVPTLDEKNIGTTKALTMREMMAKHRANPTCAACHAVMDPLGFALENFDATGKWRDRDRFAGVEIDASGKLPWHDGQWPRRSAQRAAAASAAIRADIHGRSADLRDRAKAGSVGHASGPPHRLGVGRDRLQVLDDRAGCRAERAVQDAPRAAAGGGQGIDGCGRTLGERRSADLRVRLVLAGLKTCTTWDVRWNTGDTTCICRRNTSHGE